MLNEKVGSLLNVQINKEFYSAYLYLEFSISIKKKDWTGMRTGIRFRLRKRWITRCL